MRRFAAWRRAGGPAGGHKCRGRARNRFRVALCDQDHQPHTSKSNGCSRMTGQRFRNALEKGLPRTSFRKTSNELARHGILVRTGANFCPGNGARTRPAESPGRLRDPSVASQAPATFEGVAGAPQVYVGRAANWGMTVDPRTPVRRGSRAADRRGCAAARLRWTREYPRMGVEGTGFGKRSFNPSFWCSPGPRREAFDDRRAIGADQWVHLLPQAAST